MKRITEFFLFNINDTFSLENSEENVNAIIWSERNTFYMPAPDKVGLEG